MTDTDKENRMIVVNLFGAPGAGKSTGAAYIFSKLKMAGVNAELITEFAKDKTWEENVTALDNQAYVFGKQSYRMSRCRDKVDVLVTDSPLFLSILYNYDKTLGEDFNKVVLNVFNSYDNINFFVRRAKPYNPIGRNQTEEEAAQLSAKLEFKLDSLGLDYIEMRGEDEAYAEAADLVLHMVKKKNGEV